MQISRLTILWLAVVLAAACVTKGYAPVEQKIVAPVPVVSISRSVGTSDVPRQIFPTPVTHRVTKGETLHAIAWLYRLDHRDLIRWNGLDNPNLIFVNQILHLQGAIRSEGQSHRRDDQVRSRMSRSRQTEIVGRSPDGHLTDSVKWVWPANGESRVSTSFSGSNGIEILGEKGQVVKAAGDGKVVYSGHGLRGYGQLIIIKHSDRFLSAYAHNDVRFAEEGHLVSAGETIAHMGNTDSEEVRLHFEIRQNGKAIDPLKVLPQR